MEAEEEEVDRYADLVLHSDRVDWSDPSLTADDISKQFMGTHRYWKDEDFQDLWDKQHSAHPTAHLLEIEKRILLDQGRDNWHLPSYYGKECYQHFLSLEPEITFISIT